MTSEQLAPLTYTMIVHCSAQVAFETWTRDIGMWWPLQGHSLSGDQVESVVFEAGVGGRIYERARNGDEFDWGRVATWEPPHRLVYSWHIGSQAADATEVDVTFEAIDDQETAVRLEHRGWERFVEDGLERRAGNQQGWADVLPAFESACAQTTA